MHFYISNPGVTTSICDILLAKSDDRIIIQQSRNELLTFSLRTEMNRPGYLGDSSFIPRMVRLLLRTYDFRALKDINHPISDKSVYNEAVNIWNRLKEKEKSQG